MPQKKTATVRRRKPRTSKGPAAPPHVPYDLTPEQYTFCLTWCANGFNGTQAYLAAHPGVKANTAASEAWSYLRNPKIATCLQAMLDEKWKPVHMSGDEALARIAWDARADPRGLVGPDGKALKIQDWPDQIANSVESVEIKDDGTVKVRFTSKAAARRTILEVTGKVKGGDVGELAALLARHYKE